MTEKGYYDRLQWFKDRIGKRVFRNKATYMKLKEKQMLTAQNYDILTL